MNIKNSSISKILKTLEMGKHIVCFYETKECMFQAMIHYFTEGCENNERCVWLISAPLTIQEAENAMEREISAFEEKRGKRQLRIIKDDSWYTETKKFNEEEALQRWHKEEEDALKAGFSGLRISGNIHYLMRGDTVSLWRYEKTIDEILQRSGIVFLCAYPAELLGVDDIIDLINAHPYTLINKDNIWKIEGNIAVKHIKAAKQEIKKKMEELEIFSKLAIGRELKMIELKKR